MNEPQTLIDKLWDAHEIVRREDGNSLLWIDRHFVHEGSFHAFAKLAERGVTVAEPGLPATAVAAMPWAVAGIAVVTVAPKCAPWLRDRAAWTVPPAVQIAQRRFWASTASATCGSPPENGPRKLTPSAAAEPARNGTTEIEVAVG